MIGSPGPQGLLGPIGHQGKQVQLHTMFASINISAIMHRVLQV